MDLKQIK